MRINKYPFLLWFTENRDDLQLDLKNLKVTSEELGESNLKQIPLFMIIILKYLPLSLLLFVFYYPTSKNDILPFFSSLLIALLLIFVYFQFKDFVFKIVFYGLIFSLAIGIFVFEDFAVFLDTSITFFAEFLILFTIAFDIFFVKAYKNWYFLESVKNEIDLTLTKSKERRFFSLKFKTGVNLKLRKFSIKGYFLRIEDEDIK